MDSSHIALKGYILISLFQCLKMLQLRNHAIYMIQLTLLRKLLELYPLQFIKVKGQREALLKGEGTTGRLRIRSSSGAGSRHYFRNVRLFLLDFCWSLWELPIFSLAFKLASMVNNKFNGVRLVAPVNAPAEESATRGRSRGRGR
uniref:Uncharacterized protein n=1 Tax=Solanum tuberosum TaxID=4113 RepID=M1A310_SOLTU